MDEAPVSLITFPSDTSVYADVEAAVDHTVKQFGRLDTSSPVPASRPTTASVMATRGLAGHGADQVLGPAYLVRASLPHLRKSQGRIVLIGSVAGFVHSPGNTYGATKFAVTGLAEDTRLMVALYKIGVTLIALGQPAGVDVNTLVVRPTGSPR